MSKIEKILIGTNNQGKFKEICDLLPKKIKKISPVDLQIESPEETGKTFLENSELKAAYFCKRSKLVTLSDDSGLEIEALNAARRCDGDILLTHSPDREIKSSNKLSMKNLDFGLSSCLATMVVCHGSRFEYISFNFLSNSTCVLEIFCVSTSDNPS